MKRRSLVLLPLLLAARGVSAQLALTGAGKKPAAGAPPGLWDDFEDNSKDTSKWAGTTINPGWSALTIDGTVAETGGKVEMSIGTASRIHGYSSNNTHDLNEKYIAVHLSNFDVNAVAQTRFSFGCWNGTSEYTQWNVFNNFGTLTVNAQYNNSGAQGTLWSATYSATDHAWFRIREIAGDWYWDTAPDNAGVPGTWVNRRQRTVDGGSVPAHWNPAAGTTRFGFYTQTGSNVTALCRAAAFDTDAA